MDETEAILEKWLMQIGATDIQYVGEEAANPDFPIRFCGKMIGVEAEWLTDEHTWQISLWRALKKAIIEASHEDDSLPKWLIDCAYDPVQPRLCRRTIKACLDTAKRVLLHKIDCKGGTYQLLPKALVHGYGVEMTLLPSPRGQESVLLGLTVRKNDAGSPVRAIQPSMGTVMDKREIERISKIVAAKVEDKGQRVRGVRDAMGYDAWWMVFRDDLLFESGISIFKEDQELERVRGAVKRCEQICEFAKVIAVNPYGLQCMPYLTLWEQPEHDPLPPSP